MLNRFLHILRENDPTGNRFSYLFRESSIAAKTTLVNEGEIIKSIYFVRKGCLRLWFNSQGNDISYQFFFENQVVSGFLDNEKCPFSLESIEPSVIVSIKVSDFQILLNEVPQLKDQFLEYLNMRLASYSKLFLSRIKDSPAQRYENLIIENPEILRRVPQHYIATFLGITPVSLSRIRKRYSGK
jgi:CRP-like cAMP-binding protein